MNINQSIANPQGVSVFGSSVVRVEPDMAVIQFSVGNDDKDTRKAFNKTREDSRKIRVYLQRAGVEDVQSSRIVLNEHSNYSSSVVDKRGSFRATMSFQVILRNLDQLEEILSGLVDAGVNSIQNVSFQTSKIKAVRTEARRLAVLAAKEKAELYCLAAGTTLGRVLHIEDVNPDGLQGYEGTRGSMNGSDNASAEPGKISVGGAVVIVYALKE